MENIRQKRERNFWDHFARFYDPFMQNFSGLYEKIGIGILQELQPGFTVLDLAAGTGSLVLELAPRIKKIHGSDISPRMIALAEAKARVRNVDNAEFSVADAYQLPFAAGMYDAVVICNALHVMVQPERALAEAYRVLKKGGLLIAPTFCHGENCFSRMASFIMSLAGFKAFHRWSIKDLEQFVETHHYQVIRNETIKGIIPLTFLVAEKA